MKINACGGSGNDWGGKLTIGEPATERERALEYTSHDEYLPPPIQIRKSAKENEEATLDARSSCSTMHNLTPKFLVRKLTELNEYADISHCNWAS